MDEPGGMTQAQGTRSTHSPTQPSVRVVVLADVETNARALIDRVLRPAGIPARTSREGGPQGDILVVDVTQLRGDPLAALRSERAKGNEAPAIALAAHFPPGKLRDLFRLGVRDILLKPYRPEDLREAIYQIQETRITEDQPEKLQRRVESLRETLRRRTEEIRMLSEIGRVVASLDSLDQILTRLVEAAAYLTDAEEASIYLVDPASGSLVLRASKQAGERHASLKRLRVNDTIVGQVFRTGQPVLKQPSLEGGPVKVQTGFLVQSIINVPLRLRREVVGVLGVYNRLAMRAFNEHSLTILMALADWAGVALERATLIRRSHTKPAEQVPIAPPALTQGLRQISTSLDQLTQQESNYQRKAELQRLRDRIKDLSQLPITTLKDPSSRNLVNLPNLVVESVNHHREVARRKSLELISENTAPLPLFEGDEKRIRQVLNALISAAIRRTSRGRVLVQTHRIVVEGGRSDSLLLPEDLELVNGYYAGVAVSDTSSGLSPDTVTALTKSQTDPYAGKEGPGLSMGEIRMIVESLDGVIWFEQNPASTTVFFAVPAD